MADTHGFLTATDRAFLRGDTEYETRQGRYQRRQAIRNRTRAAFGDFSVLLESLDATEREEIFRPLADVGYHPDAVEWREAEPPEAYQQAEGLKGDLLGTLKFLYLGVRDFPVSFATLVEAAIFQTERDAFGRLVSPSLTVEETFPFDTLDTAIDKLEAGELADLDDDETRTVLEFVMAPGAYPPTEERAAAIERLDALPQFSVEHPDDE